MPVERSQGGVLCPLALDLVAGGGRGFGEWGDG